MAARDPTKLRWGGGEVSVAWHRPPGQSWAALALAHGAGYNMNTRLLIDIAEALAQQGITTVRFNFPYTEAGRRSPDPQPRLEACYRAVAQVVSQQMPHPFLGGKSLGGRIASHIVAGGLPAAGLVFLGYPLHPPGKPDRIRDAHLKELRVPMLFLQGTRDPFAQPNLLHATLDALNDVHLVEIDGGDHSFNVRGRQPGDVTAELIDAIVSFIKEHAGGKGA